ncbi:MAG: hypothetical protein LBI87_07920 [Candidatus Accumulibacter sp.]|jgi:hypothetical protein|nr:hypothetical protein [Accumulibacter sp.]
MDPNLIYEKTASGENAIQNRTRVIQRNVRMVLILVDGRSSVADLSNKIGNLQLTENALAELERGGFIRPRTEQDDTLWEESQRAADEIQQEIRSSAVEKAMRPPPKAKDGEKLPDFKQAVSFRGLPGKPGDPEASVIPPISLRSIADDGEDEESSRSAFPTLTSFAVPAPSLVGGASRPPVSAGEPGLAADGRQDPGLEDAPSGPPLQAAGKKKEPPVRKPSPLARLKSLWAGAGRVLDDEPVRLKPIRRNRTNWLGWTLYVLAGLLVLAGVTVALFPYSTFLPEIEAAFSQAVGRSVGIQEMRVNVYPVPGVTLSKIRIGQGNDAIRVREIRLQPDLTTLFSERKGFRRILVSGMEIRLERLVEISAIFASLADSANSPEIAYIRLEDTDISFGGIVLKGTQAEIQRNFGGSMQALSAWSADKSLNLTARLAAGSTNLTVEAFGWRAEANSKFVADSLTFKGRLTKDALTISGLEIRAFDGLIRGEAIVRAVARPNLSGTVAFEKINASKLGEALDVGNGLASGVIAGNMRFTANSESWPAIFSAIEGDGDFTILRGHFNGLDLADAARRMAGTSSGGATAFEQASGLIRLDEGKSRFHDLSIASGLMQSTGYVDVVKGGRLGGRLELLVKGSVNQTRVPVQISGTLDAPVALVVGRQ